MDEVLGYLAAGLVAVWGVAHAIPTRQVVAGFGAITRDNRLVILQEWLAEAVTMWGVAASIIVTTAAGGPDADGTVWLYRVAAGLLIALAALTAFLHRGTHASDLVQDLPRSVGQLGRSATRRELRLRPSGGA